MLCPTEACRGQFNIRGRVGGLNLEIMQPKPKRAVLLPTLAGFERATVQAALEGALFRRRKSKCRADAFGRVGRFSGDRGDRSSRVHRPCPDLGRRLIHVAGGVDCLHPKVVLSVDQGAADERARARYKRTAVQTALKSAARLGRGKHEACDGIVRQYRRERSDGGIRRFFIDRPAKARRSQIGSAACGRLDLEDMIAELHFIGFGACARGKGRAV